MLKQHVMKMGKTEWVLGGEMQVTGPGWYEILIADLDDCVPCFFAHHVEVHICKQDLSLVFSCTHVWMLRKSSCEGSFFIIAMLRRAQGEMQAWLRSPANVSTSGGAGKQFKNSPVIRQNSECATT